MAGTVRDEQCYSRALYLELAINLLMLGSLSLTLYNIYSYISPSTYFWLAQPLDPPLSLSL